MGSNNHKAKKQKRDKNQQDMRVSLCPQCGNVVPKRKTTFRCKYCGYLIKLEENNVKELWRDVES